MTPTPNLDDVECILVNGKQVPLLKCPLPNCDFRNIDEDTILHHIRWNDNPAHWVDVDKVDKNDFFVLKPKVKAKRSKYAYFSKWDLPSEQWPRIKCIWCEYEDPLPRDLSYHFLERHRKELYTDILRLKYTPNRYWLYEIDQVEYGLDEAIRLAKLKSSGGVCW